MTTTPTTLEDDVKQLRDELAAKPANIGWLRAHADAQADSLCFDLSTHLGCEPSDAAVVNAVQSLIGKIEAQALRLEAAERDAKRIDWLADESNTIGNVELPTDCVMSNLGSLRGAIDSAMAMGAAIASETKP